MIQCGHLSSHSSQFAFENSSVSVSWFELKLNRVERRMHCGMSVDGDNFSKRDRTNRTERLQKVAASAMIRL
jgi:hypothetical protein